MVEQWRNVPNAPGYEVSDKGRIRSTNKSATGDPKPLIPVIRKGYAEVRIMKGKAVSVHGLVLAAFVGPRPTDMECRHLNGDPLDNRLENLKWGTRAENYADRRIHGTSSDGERHGNSKIDNETARAICAAPGKPRDVAKAFGVSAATVGIIKRGQSWRRVTGVPVVHPGTAGEHNGRARLTDEAVLLIRASSERSDVLARQYGVCRNTIESARRGTTWKHLPV